MRLRSPSETVVELGWIPASRLPVLCSSSAQAVGCQHPCISAAACGSLHSKVCGICESRGLGKGSLHGWRFEPSFPGPDVSTTGVGERVLHHFFLAPPGQTRSGEFY